MTRCGTEDPGDSFLLTQWRSFVREAIRCLEICLEIYYFQQSLNEIRANNPIAVALSHPHSLENPDDVAGRGGLGLCPNFTFWLVTFHLTITTGVIGTTSSDIVSVYGIIHIVDINDSNLTSRPPRPATTGF